MVKYTDMMEAGAIAHGLGLKPQFFNWLCDCCRVVIGFADFTEMPGPGEQGPENILVVCEDCYKEGGQ